MSNAGNDNRDERLRYDAAAKYLGIPTATLRSMVCRRQIPHYRISGRLVVFTRADLDAWLASRRVDVA